MIECQPHKDGNNEKIPNVYVSSWIINCQKLNCPCFDLSRLFTGETLEMFPSGRRVGLSSRFDLISAEMKKNSEIIIKLWRNEHLIIFFYIVLTLFPLCRGLTDSWELICSSASWQLIPLWSDSSWLSTLIWSKTPLIGCFCLTFS